MSRRPRESGRAPEPGHPWVVGIDPSLTRTGVVLIPPGWEPGDWASLRRFSVEGAPPPKVLEPELYELARVERMADLAERVAEIAMAAPGRVRGFVEGYAHSMGLETHAAALREYGGILRHWMALRCRMGLVPVPEASARKVLLGKCPSRDRKVITFETLRSAGAPFANADEADAFAVANYGLTEIGLTALCLG